MTNNISKIMQNEQTYYVGDIGSPLLSIAWSMLGVENGYLDLSKDIGLLSRSVFPDAWSRISTLPSGILVDEAAWQAEKTANGGTCAKFSAGDGATNFRVPVLNKVVTASAGSGSPTGSFSNIQGATGSSNIVGAVFMYPMMKMYNSVSEGSGVNIGALIEATTGKIDSSELIILHNDLNLYLNASTGDDSNTGLSSDEALSTWSAMHDLLAKVNPRGHIVTVNISGIQPGDAKFALPQYSSANLKLLGTSTETDGFATGTVFTMAMGAFAPNNIQFGSLEIRTNVGHWSSGQTIRVTGNASTIVGLYVDGEGALAGSGFVIEYAGTLQEVIGCSGSISLWNCAFVAIDTPNLTNFCRSQTAPTGLSLNSCTYSGPVNLTGVSVVLNRGGNAAINNITSLPGGGTITRSNASNINAYGAAVANMFINANGTPGGAQHGFVSCSKSGDGTYNVTHAPAVIGNGNCRLATIQGGVIYLIRLVATGRTTTQVITTNISGVASDTAFNLAVF